MERKIGNKYIIDGESFKLTLSMGSLSPSVPVWDWRPSRRSGCSNPCNLAADIGHCLGTELHSASKCMDKHNFPRFRCAMWS